MRSVLRILPLAGLVLGALVACSGGGSDAETPGPTATPTGTQQPQREWELQPVRIDGSTVTVPVRVFAGIDVDATLDGRRADEVRTVLPVLEFVFRDVTPGRHTIEVKDVVGHRETVDVLVAAGVARPDAVAAGLPAR